MNLISYKPMTQEEFVEKMLADYSEGEDYGGDDPFSRHHGHNKTLDDILLGSVLQGHMLYDDLDIGFDFENYTCVKGMCSDNGGKLVGLESIKDFSFVGCLAGGDWELPVFFIVYYDDKEKLRAYVPKEGNVYNKENMIAYGNDMGGDEVNEHMSDKFDWGLIKKEIEAKIGKSRDKKGIISEDSKKQKLSDKEPLTVYMMIGLPASGKSSVTKNLYEDLPVVSKDICNGSEAKERKQLEELLSEGKSVVVDDTNYSKQTRAKIISMAKQYGADVIGIYVHVEKNTALERNKGREKKVPDIAIHTLAGKFEEPSLEEGFTKLNVIDND